MNQVSQYDFLSQSNNFTEELYIRTPYSPKNQHNGFPIDKYDFLLTQWHSTDDDVLFSFIYIHYRVPTDFKLL